MRYFKHTGCIVVKKFSKLFREKRRTKTKKIITVTIKFIFVLIVPVLKKGVKSSFKTTSYTAKERLPLMFCHFLNRDFSVLSITNVSYTNDEICFNVLNI